MIKINEDNVGRMNFPTLSLDTDAFNETRLNKYFSVIQEMGGLHAAARGCAIADLQAQGKTWVINRSRVNINHYGVWPDEIKAETWPQEPVRLICPRVVRAKDQNDVVLFEAMTHWVIIDTVRVRPALPKETIDKLMVADKEKFYIEPTLERMRMWDDVVKHVLNEENIKINYLDTDSNHHVNNVSYVDWCQNALPDSFRDAYKCEMIDVKWIVQTYRSDKLIVTLGAENADEMEKDKPELFFKIERLEENGEKTLAFQAETIWKKRELF